MSLFSDARNIVSLTTRHSDLALVGLLVAVIALMIMPLPTALVDTLIGANLALSFAIMMMTMYVRTPLEFSSFPTMLLFTTLFRVGLNITTTRLILLNADAGEIIQTFGEFALGGNFVVGAVVFLILTIVQFLVIAKGAERVAEVGARFTLDAMPGKQMSIDADMRAGVIDMEEAQRRAELAVDVQSDIIDAYNDSILGEEREVLCEGYDSQAQMFYGRSYAESPDIDGRIWFTADSEIAPGSFVNVRLTGTMDGETTGELV